VFGAALTASERRFREELKQIPTVNHEVYGTCIAPTYRRNYRRVQAVQRRSKLPRRHAAR
jgi:hypothetical protein